VGVPVATLFFVLSASAQQSVVLAPIGGSGGGEFSARCAPGDLLGGFELRVGDVVDAIRPLCRTPLFVVKTLKVPLHYENDGRLIPEHYDDVVSYNVNGAATASTDWFGGPGGGVKFLVCPDHAPVVSSIYVEAEGAKTVAVRRLTLRCEGITGGLPTAFRDDDRWLEPNAAAYAAPTNPNGDFVQSYSSVVTFAAPKAIDDVTETHGKRVCPVSPDNHATLAVGIQGRSGQWLDALGLICEFPKLPGPIKTVGRVKVGVPGPPITICNSAAIARWRNSPAASGLEAQCAAERERLRLAGETPPPVKAVGRVKVASPADSSSRQVCVLAAAARARNSPAAPGLETNCRASLAAIGAAIAVADAVVSEARAAEGDAMFQQGFDIATGIFGDPALGAQGNRATGPRSLSIRSFLSAPGQRGFDASVKLHLSRNYNP